MNKERTPRFAHAVAFLLFKVWTIFLVGAFFWLSNSRNMDSSLIGFLMACALTAFLGAVILFPFWIARDLKEAYGVTKLKASAIGDLMLFQLLAWNPRKGKVTLHVGFFTDKAYRIIWDGSGEASIELSSIAREEKTSLFSQLPREDRENIFFLYGFERAFLPEELSNLYFGILVEENSNHPKIVSEGGVAYWYLYAAGIEPYYPRTSPKGDFGYFAGSELNAIYADAAREGVGLALVIANSEGYDTKKVNSDFLVNNREDLNNWYAEITKAKDGQL